MTVEIKKKAAGDVMTIEVDGRRTQLVFESEGMKVEDVRAALEEVTGGAVRIASAAEIKSFAKIQREAARKRAAAMRERAKTRARLITAVRKNKAELANDDVTLLVEAIKNYFYEDS